MSTNDKELEYQVLSLRAMESEAQARSLGVADRFF